MKQFFLAGSFALISILGYTWLNNDRVGLNSTSSYFDVATGDTTPGKKDTSRHRPKTDSSHKKDTSHHH